jgi:hypothetical protein
VLAFLDEASNFLLPYMTAEWVRLTSSLVCDWTSTVQDLDPGVSLGEAFPEMLLPTASIPSSGLTPPVFPSPALLPLTQPLISRTPSAGSTNSCPSPCESAASPIDRPVCPLPHPSYHLRDSPTSDAAPAPSLPTAIIVPRIVAPPHVPCEALSSSSSATGVPVMAPSLVPGTPASASSHSFSKWPAVEVTLIPMVVWPSEWKTCTFCSHHKQKCAPPVGSRPPFRSCTTCLNNGLQCVPAPLKPPASMWLFLSFHPAGFLTYVILGPPRSRHSKWPSHLLPPPKAAASPVSGSGSGF